MTLFEVSEKYNIPPEILKEYESWGLCKAVKKVMGSWQYDDSDLENLSLIMTLHDIGFTPDETKKYMRLKLQNGASDAKLLNILNEKRNSKLDEIHFREKQLQRLDYLRHKIDSQNDKTKMKEGD